MEFQKYIDKHNALSWHIAEALHAYFASIQLFQWNGRHFEIIKKFNISQPIISFVSQGIVSKSLMSYFFIAASRIREEKRSSLNLFSLFLSAKELGFLESKQIKLIEEKFQNTAEVYSEIKRARGMGAAHLQYIDHNIIDPMIVLKKYQIEDPKFEEFLRNCEEIFFELRHPSQPQSKSSFEYSKRQTTTSFQLLTQIAWPLPDIKKIEQYEGGNDSS